MLVSDVSQLVQEGPAAGGQEDLVCRVYRVSKLVVPRR